MKTFLVAAIMFLTYSISFGQEQTEPHFFAQCMLSINNQQDFEALDLDLKANPYIKVVRLDWPSKRLFLLTQNISELPLETFNSWLGTYVSTATCIQIGLHGTDQVNPYPFTNCSN